MNDEMTDTQRDGDGEDAFRDAMSDVEPLRNRRAEVERTRGDPTPAQLQRRQDAVADRRGSVDPNGLHQGEVALVGPRDELSWKKDGVQVGVFRKLRQGKYEVDAELDLHRLLLEPRGGRMRCINLTGRSASEATLQSSNAFLFESDSSQDLRAAPRSTEYLDGLLV